MLMHLYNKCSETEVQSVYTNNIINKVIYIINDLITSQNRVQKDI